MEPLISQVYFSLLLIVAFKSNLLSMHLEPFKENSCCICNITSSSTNRWQLYFCASHSFNCPQKGHILKARSNVFLKECPKVKSAFIIISLLRGDGATLVMFEFLEASAGLFSSLPLPTRGMPNTEGCLSVFITLRFGLCCCSLNC